MKNRVICFAPASLSNLNCGFDILGLALDHLGDEIEVFRTESKEIKITQIEGDNSLPQNSDQNLCTIVAKAMHGYFKFSHGIDIKIRKGFKAGSGLGSSSASCVATAAAINELFDLQLSTNEIMEWAMVGEEAASGSRHADNIAPATLGGLTLVQSTTPLNVLPISVPEDLVCVVVYPDLTIKTKEARSILPKKINLKTSTQQSANLASMLTMLSQNQLVKAGEYMIDLIAEPYRKKLIPQYEDLKLLAKSHSALCFGITGSGPSMFSFIDRNSNPEELRIAFERYHTSKSMKCTSFISEVNRTGYKITLSE